jgi:hypothetical protein
MIFDGLFIHPGEEARLLSRVGERAAKELDDPGGIRNKTITRLRKGIRLMETPSRSPPLLVNFNVIL